MHRIRHAFQTMGPVFVVSNLVKNRDYAISSDSLSLAGGIKLRISQLHGDEI